MRARKILTIGMPILALAYVAALLVAVPGAAYITVGRWTSNFVDWRTQFQNGVASPPFPASAYSLVVTATNRWSNASTGKNFNFINYTGISGPVLMNINRTSFSAAGWAGDPGVTQVTFSGANLGSATVNLNSDWTWNTTCGFNQASKQADFLTVALHETGHAVSLNHDSRFTSAVMWPNYTCKQSLTTDDLNGIAALYP
jgi:hypothetical protein